VLASVTLLRQSVDDVTGLIRGRLVVGMVTACTVTALFDALATFQLAHPGVEITLFEDNSDRLIEGVRAGTTDLALIGAAGMPPPELEALTVISERLVAAVPSGHPLALRRRATLAEISAYPIVSLPQGTGIRTVFDQACAAQGLHPDITLQASAPGAVADLALRGLGVAILSESMTSNYTGRLHALAVEDVVVPALLALVWKETKNPALLELLQDSRDSFTHSRTSRVLASGGRAAR
jgi:DNA-binding transcriptional LysR family regulator